MNYLVDLGQFVRVVAPGPRGAFELASTSVFGRDHECPIEHPVVYQLDSEGAIVEVYA